MVLRIMRIVAMLLAVLIPVLLARVFFAKQWPQWFERRETSYFSMGLPVTGEGWGLSLILLIVIVLLLLVINTYL